MIKTANIIPLSKIARRGEQFFTYTVPASLKIEPGQLVKIPLGRSTALGIVHDLKPNRNQSYRLKPITGLVDQRPFLTKAQLELAHWMADYYATALGPAVKTMLPKLAVRPPKFSPTPIRRDRPPTLTPDQQAALEKIWTGPKTVSLLFGVTGSGKTEIYLRAIDRAIAAGQQCLVLIPEISLTPQTVSRFQARFGSGLIATLHSRLSYGQRFREWQRIRDGEAKIVIGPRSALFAPVQKLGLIIIDEEHESSYKQWDLQPRYHARETAIQYAQITGARVILGSATPAIETYYAATAGRFNLAVLPKRIVQAAPPPVEIIDMREELRGGNKSILSDSLRDNLEAALAKKQQAILFINRRGAATFVMCRDCGFVPVCPRCQVSLTFHFSPGSNLLCHHCGYIAPIPRLCPKCHGARIRYFGTGTQKVEAEVKKAFPRAKILRLDTDTTQRAKSHEDIFRTFASGGADILIGTQMVAKGFDLPNVALIGIISADTSLQLPDFRSNERTFQLLTQVAGRAGRGQDAGKVVLQTYHPDHPTVRAASRHDYLEFYRLEIEQRRLLGYPPFKQQIKIVLTDDSSDRLQKHGRDLAKNLASQLRAASVLGPIPAFVPKTRDRFVSLILINGPADKKIITSLVSDGVIDVDPVDLIS